MSSSSYSALERGEPTVNLVEVPASTSRMWSSRQMFVGAFTLLAAVAVIALAAQSDGSEVLSVSTVSAQSNTRAATFKQVGKSQKLDDEEIEDQAMNNTDFNFVPNLDKIHFPNTYAAWTTTFGAHLTWAVIILIFAALTWIYVRFIRPQTWFKDLLKQASAAATKPLDLGDALGKVPADLDENDIVSTLVLVPGEAIFFNEAASKRSLGTVYKLSVTNLRIIAQKAETTLFGTCQVGAREDSWPLENVSKVSVITGEFNGHSVSGLIHYCWTYFFITMGFDLLQAFVVENIQSFLGNAGTQFPELIGLVDTSISLVCNFLFLIAIVYAFAAMALIIFPQSSLKVYLKREMEEVGGPAGTCCGACCGSNSSPMETFTFSTREAYRAYQAILAAKAGAGTGRVLQAGVVNRIPPTVFQAAT